jgi:polyisoprenoid-binding protein YceI
MGTKLRQGGYVIGLLFGTAAWAQDAPVEAPAEAEAAVEAPAAEPAAPVTYKVSATQSKLAVLVKYDRNALIAGHDHVVQTAQPSGTVVWNPADPSQCKVDISFPASSLEVDPAGTREAFGIEGTTSASDKGKILANLLGKRQIDADNHPTITYTSSSCKASGSGFEVQGALTLHGVTKLVNTQMTIDASEGSFKASGRFSATHEDFGMKPFTAALGALRNDTNLGFRVDVVAAP